MECVSGASRIAQIEKRDEHIDILSPNSKLPGPVLFFFSLSLSLRIFDTNINLQEGLECQFSRMVSPNQMPEFGRNR